MNAWMQSMGLDFMKPLLTALLLPPVPLLLLTLLGAWTLSKRRLLGWALVLSSVSLQWICWTPAGADLATQWLLDPPPALRDPETIKSPPRQPGRTVIVVLGGGRTAAAEYPEVSLNLISMERLRYAIWLSQETGLPLAFSGGIGPGFTGPSEGSIARRIAKEEFHHPLQWVEDRSRDTHENADRTVEMLRTTPLARLVLVTHDLHMPRSLRNFKRARDAAGLTFEIVPAPVGITEKGPDPILSDFYPSPSGIARTRYAWREWLGMLAGA
jgi:uncharacterized SAM-binding protein YcdF (DUF218 family)